MKLTIMRWTDPSNNMHRRRLRITPFGIAASDEIKPFVTSSLWHNQSYTMVPWPNPVTAYQGWRDRLAGPRELLVEDSMSKPMDRDTIPPQKDSVDSEV